MDFYILSSEADRARLTFACRIAEKAVLKQHNVLIHTGADHEAQELDELLWTFSQSSFVPHRIVRDGEPALASEPVLIGAGAELRSDRCDMLINLADEVPEFFSRYERVAEVIDGDPGRRNAGRQRFRYYRDRGYQLNTHEID